MELSCAICLEKPLIPVRFRCFHPGFEKNCDSFSVVCARCADAYLEFDPFVRRAVNNKKCMYCDVHCDIAALKREECYEKQYLLMKMDPASYTCPQCSEFEGVQLDLDAHMCNECPLRLVECAQCPFSCPAREMEYHKKECEGHFQCRFCRKSLPLRQEEHHMTDRHHQTRCRFCRAWIAARNMKSHLQFRCIYEENCFLCNQKVHASKIYNHYMTHYRMLNQEIDRINALIQFLDARKACIPSRLYQHEKRHYQHSIKKRIDYLVKIEKDYL